MVAMDDHARVGGGISAEDEDDFTVAQDTEFDEPVEVAVAVDDDRPIDDGALDDVPGIDAERRVDLAEEPGTTSETSD